MADDGLWEGWLEFVLAGDEETVRTARETEQAERDDLDYWAQGLSATYLEGALERALRPLSSSSRAKENARDKAKSEESRSAGA